MRPSHIGLGGLWQHCDAKSVIIGFDARETSPAPHRCEVRDAGSDVINIGMAGTEEMYWAVTEFGACAGMKSPSQSDKLWNEDIKSKSYE